MGEHPPRREHPKSALTRQQSTLTIIANKLNMIVVSRTVSLLTVLTSVLVAAGGCSSSDEATGDDNLQVVAGFYPLAWVAQSIAGNRAEIETLTEPGAEPHDLELTPQTVASIGEADLVVYLSTFQPAVDDAVAQEAGDRAFDVAEAAQLDLTYTPIVAGHEETGEAGSIDPHFWLDPLRLSDVGDAVATRLGHIDPEGAQVYVDNAATLRARLEELDRQITADLTTCRLRDLVTSHTAFGYLAQRYDMRQVGITGLVPEEEPSPSEVAAVSDFVRSNGVRTIYYETLVSPAVAETIAQETGARTAVLDPLEGLTEESAGEDYLEVMRANAQTLHQGQDCA
jgi:zinc transport system substrate-binding protein